MAKKLPVDMNRVGTASKSGLAPELEAIIKSDDNKFCVDCGAKGPRWASVNLGYVLMIHFEYSFPEFLFVSTAPVFTEISEFIYPVSSHSH